MATKIRLKRMGRKKRPFYRIVIADSRSPRDGRFIESIGYYNPIAEPIDLKIDEEKATKWLKNGAIPTETVKSLFRMRGITLRFDLIKKGFPENKIREEYQKHQLLQDERKKRKALLKKIKKKAVETQEEQQQNAKENDSKND
ncbi:MAG: 30S ribosomal protein S16 [Candidatus Helarchaeota archaeon]|nr:30S ribosomal protein S16 [Candidatus Helarchaeota archaeon]